MRKENKTKKWVDYYDQADIFEELIEEPIHFNLDPRLKRDILSNRRKRKLKNMAIKMDPLQVIAIRKLATKKSIPYQTLIRHWLSEVIKKELTLNRA
ncbi:MAG: hypothetical protein Q8P64_02985 [Deltaproteobacteria bacterium]|nr:hypothetical protein [Deltaproteobacteria bacterium]